MPARKPQPNKRTVWVPPKVPTPAPVPVPLAPPVPSVPTVLPSAPPARTVWVPPSVVAVERPVDYVMMGAQWERGGRVVAREWWKYGDLRLEIVRYSHNVVRFRVVSELAPNRLVVSQSSDAYHNAYHDVTVRRYGEPVALCRICQVYECDGTQWVRDWLLWERVSDVTE